MHWTAIQQAHSDGFHHYDLGALPVEVARSACHGTEWSPDTGGSWSKLAFGGDIVIYPDAYDMALGPVVGPLLGRAARARPLGLAGYGLSVCGARTPPSDPWISRRYRALLKPAVVKLRGS